MDKYGPLYHRNTALLPGALARIIIGAVELVGLVGMVLGTIAVIQLS